MDPLMYL